MTETYVADADQTKGVYFMQFFTTVRGKLCWNITFRDDVISREEGRAYIECIKEVLNKVDLE